MRPRDVTDTRVNPFARQGFDPEGAAHFKFRLVNSRRWIGTTEIYTALSFLGIRSVGVRSRGWRFDSLSHVVPRRCRFFLLDARTLTRFSRLFVVQDADCRFPQDKRR